MTANDIAKRIEQAKTEDELESILSSDDLRGMDRPSKNLALTAIGLRSLDLRCDIFEERLKRLEGESHSHGPEC